MKQHPYIVATWADSGKVHIWDIRPQLTSLDKPVANAHTNQPLFTFEGHPEEGFAMDWSRVAAGRLITGDCRKNILLWNPSNASWVVDNAPFMGHTQSVEDLQWSPAQKDVFASCSVDRTVRIWDTRTHKKSMLFVAAHTQDVNVISWNTKVQHLLVSGSDDGSFKIWDLRKFKSDSPAAFFKWHKKPVTSVEWHPTDESVLAVSSEDHSITIWDMALEDDPEAIAQGAQLQEAIPPQLFFVHQGQKHIKELHWHPQISSMMVSTAEDGFNFFKPSNLETGPEMATGAAPAAAAAAASSSK
jgi:ribosome assembly protein RRB1